MINLDEYKNKQNFEVPDEYFETLQEEVMRKIMKERKQGHNRKTIITIISSVAASVLILVGVLNFLPRADNSDIAAVIDTVKKISESQNNIGETPEIQLAEVHKKKNKEIQIIEGREEKKHIIEKKGTKLVNQNENDLIDYYQDELIDNDYLEI